MPPPPPSGEKVVNFQVGNRATRRLSRANKFRFRGRPVSRRRRKRQRARERAERERSRGRAKAKEIERERAERTDGWERHNRIMIRELQDSFYTSAFKFSGKTHSKRHKGEQRGKRDKVRANRSEIKGVGSNPNYRGGRENVGRANVQLPKGLVVLAIT
jgi:hypothetical protein